MPDKRKTLARIHRVRELQHGLAQADEMRARDKHDSELQLAQRIAALAQSVAPSDGAGFSLAAAAHYRERLSQSATAADQRVRAAQFQSVQASERARAAHRDQVAVEKLIARARTEAAQRELRDLQNAPPARKVRHDPC
jgi:hypothetical protein